MSLSPGSRVTIALVIASSLALALHFALSYGAEPAQAQSKSVVEPDWSPNLDDDFPRGEALLLYLAGPEAEIPSWSAPWAAIHTDGEVSLLEPAPETGGQAWVTAVVGLPRASLGSLTARERGALCAVLSRWLGTLADPEARIELLQLEQGPGELEALLRWLR